MNTFQNKTEWQSGSPMHAGAAASLCTQRSQRLIRAAQANASRPEILSAAPMCASTIAAAIKQVQERRPLDNISYFLPL